MIEKKRERALKKGSNLVECKKHGLTYDMTASTGCVLCIRERKQFKTVGSRRAYLLVVAFIITLVGAAAYFFLATGPVSFGTNVATQRTSVNTPRGPSKAVVEERRKKAGAAVEKFIGELSRLAENAREDTTELGDVLVNLTNVDKGENQTQLNNWRFWVESWLGDVARIKGVDARDKIYVPQEMSAALRTAEFAKRRMKQVPNPGPGIRLRPDDEGFKDYYLPSKGSRQAWLTEISRLMAQAQSQLKKSD